MTIDRRLERTAERGWVQIRTKLNRAIREACNKLGPRDVAAILAASSLRLSQDIGIDRNDWLEECRGLVSKAAEIERKRRRAR